MKSLAEKVLSYSAIFEEQPDGGYSVSVPALPGCISEGDTFEEARTNIADAINLYVEDLLAEGEDVPNSNTHVLVDTVDIQYPHNFPQ